jgi:hypothetical protein
MGTEINDANGTPIIMPSFGLGIVGATRPPYGFRNDLDNR